MSETVTRAFELPVQRVECVDGRDGWALLRQCWREATMLANWGVQQLLRADVVRVPDTEKLPKRPRIDGPIHKGLYGLATDTLGLKTGFWAGACKSASTLLHAVEVKYDSERLNVVWHRNKAPSTYRYPHPWPVHAQGWTGCGLDEAGKPWVTLALPGGHVRLRLRGGPEFGRQIAMFKEVVKGNLPRKQLVIRQQGASLGCHRPTLEDGGKTCRVLCKIVADVPVREKLGGRCLVLLTDPLAFWVAELDGRRAWVLNADHVQRGTAAHEAHLRQLQRLSEDGKAERRLGSNRDEAIRARLGRLCAKHRNRMSSWTHETAAHLIGFAERQKVGEVFYLDRDKSFVPMFPWCELHSKLSDKLKVAGIGFYSESGMQKVSLTDVEDDGGMDLDVIALPPEQIATELRVVRLREQAGRKVLAGKRRKGKHPAVSA